jgi:hypothetical protein
MIKLGEESKECARCMVIFELYLKVEKTSLQKERKTYFTAGNEK